MNTKPWREVAIPHDDVLKGTFLQSEFAADITRVHAGTAVPEYQDAALFFGRTFITEGMRQLLSNVIQRLAGKGGDPVIQLQTSFGGGKTHSMLAVYHLASAKNPFAQLPGVRPIVEATGVLELPKARVVVLDGIALAPATPRQREGIAVRTLWGELAWQLGGAAGYAQVKSDDEAGTSPSKEALARLLTQYSPCVILVDELVAYVRQFEDGKQLSGGSFDSNLSFVQALTEGIKAVPNAVLLASLPESDREAGSERGIAALKALEHYFGRVQALWKAASADEAFEIVRRRLFERIGSESIRDDVCAAFGAYYREQPTKFPLEVGESGYAARMLSAYPIHPEVFDRLYGEWSALPGFQKTRGVLKLMAKVIHRLWVDDNRDLMILPSSLPLNDVSVRVEMVNYLPPGWDPVLEKDIDGDRSEAQNLDSREPLFGQHQAARRVARTVFLGSAPTSSNPAVRGLDTTRVLLGCAQPGQPTAHFEDALRRMQDKLSYLNTNQGRYYFDTKPNLLREMQERRDRFSVATDLDPLVQDQLKDLLRSSIFKGVHVFVPSVDVPDDWDLRLVVLPPDAGTAKKDPEKARPVAQKYLERRGESPRSKQNRLIFLVADQDTVPRLRDQARTVLAWNSIVADIADTRLLADQHQTRQAREQAQGAADAFKRIVRETYRWLLVPGQDPKQPLDKDGKIRVEWDRLAINPQAQYFIKEIEKVLSEGGQVITEWAAVHLARELQRWYWKPELPWVSALKVFQDSCGYLYLPRLLDSTVFQKAISQGTGSTDFFGVANARENERFLGFSFGQSTSTVLSSDLLLIEPRCAEAYAEAIKPPPPPALPPGPGSTPTPSPTPPSLPLKPGVRKTHYFGSASLRAEAAALDLSKIAEEVLNLFTTNPGTQVKIKVDITADNPQGFDEATQRAVRENTKVLRFDGSEFD